MKPNDHSKTAMNVPILERSLAELETRLVELDSERDSLQAQIQKLRKRDPMVGANGANLFSPTTFPSAPINKACALAARIRFFLDLFHGRRDVYAARFENRKTGKAGYQPVCANLWRRPLCQKPKVRCHECHHRLLVPLSEEIIAQHLSGKITLGVYPMLLAETCRFVVADFDKEGWQEDALGFVCTCRKHDIVPALERSRSGKGGHVWIFFVEDVPARTARQMVAALITETMIARPSMGLDSYDRLLPNQDTMPKGGFGNLTNAINYFSSGDEVVDNNSSCTDFSVLDLATQTGSFSIAGLQRHAWIAQEQSKGGFVTLILHGVDSQGGWGFNSQYNVFTVIDGSLLLPPVITYSHLDPALADILPDSVLRTNSFFKPFNVPELYDPNQDILANNPVLMHKLLAEAIPALSHATGRNPIEDFGSPVNGDPDNPDGSIDLMTKKRSDNAWPAVRGSTHNWLHGDFRDVAYFYNFSLYNDIVNKGGLK
jgi:hypothetical protein